MDLAGSWGARTQSQGGFYVNPLNLHGLFYRPKDWETFSVNDDEIWN